MSDHVVGLPAGGGTAEDWTRAFESLVRRAGILTDGAGLGHRLRTVRLAGAALVLGGRPRCDLVVDRPVLRPAWLTASALAGAYLLNNPFTARSAGRHEMYAVLARLGLRIPPTLLVEAGGGSLADGVAGFARTVGGALVVKASDGSTVTVRDEAGLREALEQAAGAVHVQAAVDDPGVVARVLTVGPETMVMKYRPGEPLHERYQVDHHFLNARAGAEVVTVSKVVNAVFRWELNSCDLAVSGDVVHPLDHAGGNPELAVTSLHYYFPWAMTALLRWSAYCLVTHRQPRLDTGLGSFLAVADNPAGAHADRVAAYRALADAYFETERYEEFCARRLPHVGEVVQAWVGSAEFRALLCSAVRALYPPHEHERFLAHYGGLIDFWVHDQGSRSAS